MVGRLEEGVCVVCLVFTWPGGDLLFRGLSRSTMGAEGFDGRVRDGIGCRSLAMTTRPRKDQGFRDQKSGIRDQERRSS